MLLVLNFDTICEKSIMFDLEEKICCTTQNII